MLKLSKNRWKKKPVSVLTCGAASDFVGGGGDKYPRSSRFGEDEFDVGFVVDGHHILRHWTKLSGGHRVVVGQRGHTRSIYQTGRKFCVLAEGLGRVST